MKPSLPAYARVSYHRELHGDLAGAVEAMRFAVSAGGSASSNAYVETLLGDLQLARGRVTAATRGYRGALRDLPSFPRPSRDSRGSMWRAASSAGRRAPAPFDGPASADRLARVAVGSRGRDRAATGNTGLILPRPAPSIGSCEGADPAGRGGRAVRGESRLTSAGRVAGTACVEARAEHQAPMLWDGRWCGRGGRVPALPGDGAPFGRGRSIRCSAARRRRCAARSGLRAESERYLTAAVRGAAALSPASLRLLAELDRDRVYLPHDIHADGLHGRSGRPHCRRFRASERRAGSDASARELLGQSPLHRVGLRRSGRGPVRARPGGSPHGPGARARSREVLRRKLGEVARPDLTVDGREARLRPSGEPTSPSPPAPAGSRPHAWPWSSMRSFDARSGSRFATPPSPAASAGRRSSRRPARAPPSGRRLRAAIRRTGCAATERPARHAGGPHRGDLLGDVRERRASRAARRGWPRDADARGRDWWRRAGRGERGRAPTASPPCSRTPPRAAACSFCCSAALG